MAMIGSTLEEPTLLEHQADLSLPHHMTMMLQLMNMVCISQVYHANYGLASYNEL